MDLLAKRLTKSYKNMHKNRNEPTEIRAELRLLNLLCGPSVLNDSDTKLMDNDSVLDEDAELKLICFAVSSNISEAQSH